MSLKILPSVLLLVCKRVRAFISAVLALVFMCSCVLGDFRPVSSGILLMSASMTYGDIEFMAYYFLH